MKPPLLIIFYRNPELGKVKSRLAATIGEEKALAIYIFLSSHIRQITTPLICDKVVYYSNYIDTEDSWSEQIFQKRVQHGNDLGSKMLAAFEESFSLGYEQICIIGTDCLELDTQVIENAFDQLQFHDVVIGPAHDGGYYLLGMKKLYPDFFRDKLWGTSSVLLDTLQNIKRLQLSFFCLPELSDIDTESDLPESMKF